MKQRSNKNRYELPGDPGFITRLWWAIEDYVSLNGRATFGLVIFALVLLWIILYLALGVPGPY